MIGCEDLANAGFVEWWEGECDHRWREVHFTDEYQREHCELCGVDRGDYEHDSVSRDPDVPPSEPLSAIMAERRGK